jgi:hypothetical protein
MLLNINEEARMIFVPWVYESTIHCHVIFWLGITLQEYTILFSSFT